MTNDEREIRRKLRVQPHWMAKFPCVSLRKTP